MRRYDDPVDVRRGWITDVLGGSPEATVAGAGRGTEGGTMGREAPEQFLWRGRLWKVRSVVAHWVETGPWWQEQRPDETRDLLAERELWRVEAGDVSSSGVFDLSFDWSRGSWLLVGCAD